MYSTKYRNDHRITLIGNHQFELIDFMIQSYSFAIHFSSFRENYISVCNLPKSTETACFYHDTYTFRVNLHYLNVKGLLARNRRDI